MCTFVTLLKITFTNNFYNFLVSQIGVNLNITKGFYRPKMKDKNANNISGYRILK